jgi:hypothetical protein
MKVLQDKGLQEGAYISLPREILQEMVDSGEIVYDEEDGCYVFRQEAV